MRIRSIRPEFYDSESMGNVSWDARFVFECLWSYVQDNGVNRDSARMIRGTCMPYDSDEVLPRIEAALDELEQVGCIVRYEWNGKRLLWLPNFLTYQKITNPSTCNFPKPDGAETGDGSAKADQTLRESARNCQTLSDISSRSRSRSSSRSSNNSGGGGSKSTLTRARAREATTPTAETESDDEGMIAAWKPGAEDYELAKRLHDQGKPLVDVDALAARYRDKLTGRGFEACGVGRHTPAALRAGFRMWISREAEWRAHDPKPTHTPPRVEPKPNAHSWSDVTVRHLMAPYRSMFPTAGEGGRGPSKPWYEACERVARMLNDGMGEREVATRLADEYDNQKPKNEINDP